MSSKKKKKKKRKKKKKKKKKKEKKTKDDFLYRVYLSTRENSSRTAQKKKRKSPSRDPNGSRRKIGLNRNMIMIRKKTNVEVTLSQGGRTQGTTIQTLVKGSLSFRPKREGKSCRPTLSGGSTLRRHRTPGGTRSCGKKKRRGGAPCEKKISLVDT